MGEYIYRRTSRVSEVELPSGIRVNAVHLAYAYKPYLNWDGEVHNRRMRRTAKLAVANANRSLAAKGYAPEAFTHAVTEHNGSCAGGTIFYFPKGVPELIGDYSDRWSKAQVGVVPYPCHECGGLTRDYAREHPECYAREQGRFIVEAREREVAREKAREQAVADRRAEAQLKARAEVEAIKAKLVAAEAHLANL